MQGHHVDNSTVPSYHFSPKRTTGYAGHTNAMVSALIVELPRSGGFLGERTGSVSEMSARGSAALSPEPI